MITLWTEKYRPKNIEGYVFRDETQRRQIVNWIQEKSFPQLLISGRPGIGKTTMAKILINEIGIPNYDVLEINASRERGIDEVREKITNFISMIPFGPFKVVLLDEADFLTLPAQASLRGVMEEYHETARFILTCNLPNKIIPALHSRCQTFHVEKVDQTEFTTRMATILLNENVDFDLDTLDTFVKSTYPDLRKCINLLQQNVIDHKLLKPNEHDTGESDWRLDMVDCFKAKDIRLAREVICANARPEEMEEIFRWLYDNLDLIGDTEEIKDQALLIIKQGLVDHTIIADAELNMAATLVKLSMLQSK
jgi:replication factor C small subunit